MRAELSPGERARRTDRRKEIYEARHPEAKHGAAGAAARWNADAQSASAFTAGTCKATGRARRAVQIGAEGGKKIEPDVMDSVVGTHGVFATAA